MSGFVPDVVLASGLYHYTLSIKHRKQRLQSEIICQSSRARSHTVPDRNFRWLIGINEHSSEPNSKNNSHNLIHVLDIFWLLVLAGRLQDRRDTSKQTDQPPDRALASQSILEPWSSIGSGRRSHREAYWSGPETGGEAHRDRVNSHSFFLEILKYNTCVITWSCTWSLNKSPGTSGFHTSIYRITENQSK